MRELCFGEQLCRAVMESCVLWLTAIDCHDTRTARAARLRYLYGLPTNSGSGEACPGRV